ncbi:MAG TPA: sensor domain-containing diguanylate cyclase [Candidatus Saccharimonadales bacterium]|nr:sensor domain-containing diguanylate cyclase [Candidatus Saccharimonadales bacterium]
MSILVGIVGAAGMYGAEVVAGPGLARSVLADLAWTGFAFGAVFSNSRAALASAPRDRAAWIWILLGTISWAVGQLFWDLYDIVEITPPTPAPHDLSFLAAALLYLVGSAAFLLRGEQRLALFALALDISAVVLTAVAGIALYVSDAFSTEMIRHPLATSVALLYPALYVAASAAALSTVWGLANRQIRRAHVSLFIGIALNAAGFTLSLPAVLHGTFAAGTISDPLLMLGVLAIAMAGTQWVEERDAATLPRFSDGAVQASRMFLPGVVAVLSATFLVASQLGRGTTREVVAGCVAGTVLLLATRAGLALYTNWRLGERERRRASQFEALYDVGLATSGEQTLDEVIAAVTGHATALTRCDGAMLALAEEDGSCIIRALDRERMPQLKDSVGEPLAGIALECLETRELVVATRYAAHPRSTGALHDVIASALAVPLIAHGRIIGTITVYSSAPRLFIGETQRLFRLYAAQAAIAISNARLLSTTRQLASHDPLTGLLNRRILVERLEAETAEARRHGDAFCVVLCDVDGLKAVNDTAGHLVGDDVLMRVAKTLREGARAEDVVARFGGDEFVLLLPRTALDAAQQLVGRLVTELPEHTYMWGGSPHALPRVSFGVASFPADGLLADTLIAAADARMYADKARARGRVR